MSTNRLGPSESFRSAFAATVRSSDTARRVEGAGFLLARFGLIVTLGWIGAMKFTVAEAAAIESLISGSPFMSWLLDVADLRTVSAWIGVVEIVTAVFIAFGVKSSLAGVIGGLMGTGTFLVTLSFLFTSTSYEHTIPFLSPGGSFIVKDLVLLGASLMVLARSWAWLADSAVRA
ncbi:DUF417 family protein [Nocardia sp. GCM10030253]|uniref:DUF417 family protein n=1 Tax=Nocardia sp. GCM10030253 TaxID=3273404 RepID=UPI003645127D